MTKFEPVQHFHCCNSHHTFSIMFSFAYTQASTHTHTRVICFMMRYSCISQCCFPFYFEREKTKHILISLYLNSRDSWILSISKTKTLLLIMQERKKKTFANKLRAYFRKSPIILRIGTTDIKTTLPITS